MYTTDNTKNSVSPTSAQLFSINLCSCNNISRQIDSIGVKLALLSVIGVFTLIYVTSKTKLYFMLNYAVT